MHPYESLPDKSFWSTAVARRNMFDIGELWDPRFVFDPRMKVATFGSCFAQHIGKALEARLEVTIPHAWMPEVSPLRDALQELLNLSQLTLLEGEGEVPSARVAKADGVKCERCWHWETDVGTHAAHPTLCRRCVEAVALIKA